MPDSGISGTIWTTDKNFAHVSRNFRSPCLIWIVKFVEKNKQEWNRDVEYTRKNWFEKLEIEL